MKTIGLLAYPGCMSSQLFGLKDAFAVASRVAELHQATPLQTQFISADKATVVIDTDVLVKCDTDIDNIDMLVVPGFYLRRGAQLPRVLADLHAEAGVIKRVAEQGHIVASNCVGLALLAEAGVTSSPGEYSTAWYYADTLRQRYPHLHIDTNSLVSRADNIISAGAMSAWQDLSCYLLGEFYNDKVVRAYRQYMLLDSPRASQAPYVDFQLSRVNQHSFADQVEACLDDDLQRQYDLAALAKKLDTSERTLLRKYKQARGMSPLKYLQARRMQAARAALENSDATIAVIAQGLGYQDLSAFRAIFTRETGVPPGTYRRQATQRLA